MEKLVSVRLNETALDALEKIQEHHVILKEMGASAVIRLAIIHLAGEIESGVYTLKGENEKCR